MLHSKGGRALHSKTRQQAKIGFDKGEQADDDSDESTPGTQGGTPEQQAESGARAIKTRPDI